MADGPSDGSDGEPAGAGSVRSWVGGREGSPAGAGMSDDFDSDEFREFLRDRRRRERGRGRGRGEEEDDWKGGGSTSKPPEWDGDPTPFQDWLIKGPENIAGSYDSSRTIRGGIPHIQKLGKRCIQNLPDLALVQGLFFHVFCPFHSVSLVLVIQLSQDGLENLVLVDVVQGLVGPGCGGPAS